MQFSKSGRINKALYDMQIYSYKDVIYHLPRRYEDMSLTRETGLLDKERVVAIGQVAGSPVTRIFKHLTQTKFNFLTENNNVFHVEAWNRPYLSKNLVNGEVYTFIGTYDAKHDKFNLTSINKGREISNTIRPIYSLHHDIENYWFNNLVYKAFREIDPNQLVDEVPEYFMRKYRLNEKRDALYKLHFPQTIEDIRLGQRVLKYEECLNFSLRTQLIRAENKELVKDNVALISKEEVSSFIKTLPYQLTNDQESTLDDILNDMNDGTLMYRLLQGDVGTGKTLVAALALYGNYLRNDQGAFMAPTDALARQHYANFVKMFKNTNIRIALLLGSQSTKERAAIRSALINKEIDIVIGTHVLFSKDINYLSLGLAVIDEQHKFGVNQRSLLASKGSHADLLLMSATPIPRTLALTLYGDLDVSTLNQFPFNERKIKTQIVSAASKNLLKRVQQSIDSNKRVFIVAPLIEEGEKDAISVEKLFATYLLKFPGKVGLLHGKLDQDEKNFVLEDFYNGTRPILVSTTVIEVGIDVKNADLMIIYDATHFSLASLHQLRGRIGRDGTEATCLLVCDSTDEDDLDKLNVLVKSNDGFFIAEEDLRRRGPGELLGVRQSGIAAFNYVNLVHDFKMFECARDDAAFILKNRDNPEFRRIIYKAKKAIENENIVNG